MELYLSSRDFKTQEKEVIVVVRDKDGNVTRHLITPDFVRQKDNGVTEETYTFKLYTREEDCYNAD